MSHRVLDRLKQWRARDLNGRGDVGDAFEVDIGPAPDTAPRIGERLREARRERGLTLVDVERDTRISQRYLEALEAERFELLPAPVYARGFMRSYARYLRLDAEAAVGAIPTSLPRPPGLEPLPGLRRRPPAALPPMNPAMIAAVALGAVLLLALLWAAPRLGGGDTETPLDSAGAVPGRDASATPVGVLEGVEEVPPFEEGEAPNFIGVSREVALETLEEIEANPLTFEQPNSAPAGRVFEQAPGPGEPLEAGDAVTLFISLGDEDGQ